jgi:hypothetical protein
MYVYFWPSTDHYQKVIKCNLLHYIWFIYILKGATCEQNDLCSTEQYKSLWTIGSFVFLYYQKTIHILMLYVKDFCLKTHLIASHLIVPFILKIVDCICRWCCIVVEVVKNYAFSFLFHSLSFLLFSPFLSMLFLFVSLSYSSFFSLSCWIMITEIIIHWTTTKSHLR